MMDTNSWRYESLADRNVFNASVQHIKTVLDILDRVSSKENLADVALELLNEKALQPASLHPIINVVLREKLGYRSKAVNLLGVNGEPSSIAETVKSWNGVDLVVLYHHPELGPLLLNPKNEDHFKRLDRLSRYELLDIYAGAFGKDVDAATLDKAADAVADLFAGKKVKPHPAFLKGDCVFRTKAAAKAKAAKNTGGRKAAVPAAKDKRGAKAPEFSREEMTRRGKAMPAPDVEAKPQKAAAAAEAAATAVTQTPSAGKRITPMYSVDVTNELFHNGNVEAWKRIVNSYQIKHPDCQVNVYYEGERITDLNSLFKWGKVKRGTSIQFKVVGENIADVAKLVRYLAQGASSMFEAFLRGPVNSILPLF